MLKIHSTYSVKLNNGVNGQAFQQTVRLYRRAVDFFIAVMLQESNEFSKLLNQNAVVRLAEQLSVATKRRPSVRYDFSREFYKFPCYLRRAAIAEAYGKYLSYTSSGNCSEPTFIALRAISCGLPETLRVLARERN